MVTEVSKLSHHYSGSFLKWNDLWTPEEIEENGFVFTPSPVVNHIYKTGEINRVVCTSMMFSPSYIKTYDLDAGRRRGIQSVDDYFGKKNIFKPMILDFMIKNEYHYVHSVRLGDSPGIWEGTFGTSKTYYYLYPVFIRGVSKYRVAPRTTYALGSIINAIDGDYRVVFHEGPYSCSVAGGKTVFMTMKSGDKENVFFPPGYDHEKL